MNLSQTGFAIDSGYSHDRCKYPVIPRHQGQRMFKSGAHMDFLVEKWPLLWGFPRFWRGRRCKE